MVKSAEETSHWPEYDYVIVNDELDDSVATVASRSWRRNARAASASPASPISSRASGAGKSLNHQDTKAPS